MSIAFVMLLLVFWKREESSFFSFDSKFWALHVVTDICAKQALITTSMCNTNINMRLTFHSTYWRQLMNCHSTCYVQGVIVLRVLTKPFLWVSRPFLFLSKCERDVTVNVTNKLASRKKEKCVSIINSTRVSKWMNDDRVSDGGLKATNKNSLHIIYTIYYQF